MAQSKQIGDLERNKYWLRNDSQEYNPLFVNSHAIPVAAGNVQDWAQVNKFGAAIGITSTLVDANLQATNSVYTWPTDSFTVECISSGTSAADDTLAGAGARKVTVQGLDSDFNEISEEINMAATSASSASVKTFTRVHRAYVSECGTYCDSDTGPHDGDITIRTSSGGQTHIQLLQTGLPVGQSQVARYTIPAGKTGYMTHAFFSVDSNKSATFWLLKRENADTVAAPFSPKRVIDRFDGINQSLSREWDNPIKLPAKTDVWVAVIAAGIGTNVSASFDITLVDD